MKNLDFMTDNGSDRGDRDHTQELVEEVERLRYRNRQAHIENVRIAIASLIIGSYFTEVVQSLNPIGELWYTDLIVVVAAGFLLAKLVSLSAREMGLSRLEKFAGSAVAPVGFTVAVIGYAIIIAAYFSQIKITFSTPIMLGIISLLGILGSVVSILTYWRAAAGYSTYDAAVSANSPNTTAERIFTMVSDFPSVIEPGLQITEQELVGNGVYFDFIGEDKQGQSVAIELKWVQQNSDIRTLARRFANQYNESSQKFDRVILATNIKPDESQLETIEELGIEHRRIDEYQVFGRLSEFIRWLDNRLNLLRGMSENS